MVNKLSGLTAIALTAMLPSFASADVAASLSASFGANAGTVHVNASNATGTIISPTSVSVAGAAGGFAVASSVATAYSSGAAAGATSNSNFPPIADVTYKGGAGAYETSVSFAPSPGTLQAIADQAALAAVQAQCAQGFSASQGPSTQAGTSGALSDISVNVGFTTVTIPLSSASLLITDGPITNGPITVTCL